MTLTGEDEDDDVHDDCDRSTGEKRKREGE